MSFQLIGGRWVYVLLVVSGGGYKTFDLQTTPALAAFIDDPVNGDWELQVSDHAKHDEGELVQWRIALITQKVITQASKEEVVPNIEIPDNDPAGIESLSYQYRKIRKDC
jgi:subtilisin-like proprotein convertase family protein